MDLFLVFFFFSLTGIFLSEIFTNSIKLELSTFLVLLTPFFLFFLTKIKNKKITVPLKETAIYAAFLLFSIISTFYAIDKELAIKSILLYVSGYLFFLFSFNYQEILNKYFKFFLVSISLFSCLIFLMDKIFHLNLFLYERGLFFNYGHYQIGNLLVLGLISIFPNILSLFFFAFILFSYSRTAHISLIIVLAVQTLRNLLDKKIVLIGCVVIFFSIIFIFLKSNNLYQTGKLVTNNRNVYFSYAIASIKEFPLFGVGPGNFIYTVFKRQINVGQYTDRSENLILEVLSENGILAGIFFVIFILLIFYRSKKNVSFLLFLSLTIMFMADFSYGFKSILIIWFVLGGLILDTKKKREMNIDFPMMTIFVIVQAVLFSQILLKQGLWRQSLMIYPFQKKAYLSGIAENIKLKDKQQAYYFLNRYDQNFGRSISIFQEINFYQLLGDKDKVTLLFEKSIWFRTFLDVNSMKRMLAFYKGFYGEKKGNEKMSDLLKQVKNSYSEKERSSDYYKRVNDFCLKTDIGC